MQLWLAGVICLAAPALAAAAEASPGAVGGDAVLSAPQQTASPEHLIGVYDELTVVVAGAPELSRTVHVRPDGYITFPLVGDIRAADETPRALALELQQRLARFVREPNVTVQLSRAGEGLSRQVLVIGAAVKPTAIPYAAGMRVLDVLIAAGGLPADADGNAAVLVRGDPAAPQRIPLRLADLVQHRGPASGQAANIMVQPGDVLVIPEGFLAGDWHRSYALTLASAFSDNYRLAPSGDEDPAVITGLTPALQVSGKGARLTGALAAALTGEYVAFSDSGFGFIPNVVGTATAELARDTLYVDAAALVTKQALDPATATSSVASNTTNLTLVQSYQMSPYLVSRIKDFAYMETRYTLAGTVTGDTNNQAPDRTGDDSEVLSDSITNGVQIRLASPPERRSRLDWQALAYGAETTRFGAGDVTTSGITASPEYALWRGFSPLLSGGYEMLSVGGDHLSGPSLAAGFKYRPSSNMRLQTLGGWRLENPQAEVRLQYELGPATKLTAAYSDSVGVGQSTLSDTLSELSYDAATRQFVNRQTELAYSASLTGVALEDTLVRTQQAVVALNHHSEPNAFEVSGYFTRQNHVDGQGSENSLTSSLIDRSSFGLALGWTRSINERTSLLTNVGFFHFTESSGNEASGSSAIPSDAFEDVRLRLGVARQLTDTVSAFLDYYFQRRLADDSLDEFTENAVVAGITRRF